MALSDRLPKFETLGHGPRKWRLAISVLPLSAFKAEVGNTFGDASGRLPVAFWRCSDRTVFLRLDRTPEQRVRDLRHEIQHALIDWMEEAYPDPGG